MNIFVTGTDTDAGKTTISAWICSGIKTKYRKLIQTGDDSDAATVKKFAPETEIIPEIYKFRAPLSAYDAVKMENKVIDIRKFQTNSDKSVIEGAGGIFVPIADNFLMIDAIKQTNSKALLVARSKLGMVNHILLSIYALRAEKVPILGIVVSGNLDKNIKETIELFSREKILAILPESDNLQQLFENTPLPRQILEILL